MTEAVRDENEIEMEMGKKGIWGELSCTSVMSNPRENPEVEATNKNIQC